jgi:mercuric ion transport protein
MQDGSSGAGGGAGTSVLSAVGLTLLGTSCCALPILLVALGAGGAVASMASSLPWLVALSEYKLATFSFTALALGYSWWRVRALGNAEACSLEDARRLRMQRWVLRAAGGVFAASLFAAYALLPIAIWFDRP